MVTKFSQITAAPSPPGPSDTFVGVSGANLDQRYSLGQVATYQGYINVKDFGAKGDGTTDDTTAIQNALNAAFGVAGSIAQTAQRKVIFPPGLYIVTGSGLTGTNWFGGVIQGSGRFTTMIQNSGGGTVITTNGCQYMRFEDIRLDCSSGSGICFDLDWTGTGTALQSNTFFNIEFSNAAIGLRIAQHNFMGSENLILNCFFENLSIAGLQSKGGNALQQTIVGGNFQACSKGIQVVSGAVNLVHGVGFQLSSTVDISIEGDTTNTMSVVGCRTESSNFINNAGQDMQISGCQQKLAGARGLFYTGNGGAVHVSGCYFQGQVKPTQASRFTMQACVADNEVIAGDWLIYDVANWWVQPGNPIAFIMELENIISFIFGSGTADSPAIQKQSIFTTDNINIIIKNYLGPVTTFASLPSAMSSIGTNAMISDCSVSTWGALAAGGGTIQAQLFSDGLAWYVSGIGSLARVTVDAVGTELHVAPPVTSATYTGITVGSGIHRALVVSLNFGYNTGTPPSAVSVTWDSGGTNQAMTQIVSGNNGSNGEAQLWGLVAPTSGNKTLAVSWTGNAEVFIVAESYTQVDQTGGATTFPHSAVTSVNMVNPKITITSAVDRGVFGAMLAGSGIGTLLGTQIYKDNGSGAFIVSAASYKAGSATVDVGWTGGANIALIAGTDILNG
jgi:hypothetical protein